MSAERDSSFPLAVARNTSRRGFLAKVGKALMVAAGSGAVGALVKPGDADAHHLCGHTYTTGSCPHPIGLPRIDARGFPLRPSDGHPIDNLARPIDRHGRPVNRSGRVLRDPDGRPLPPAPRTRICQVAGDRYGFAPHLDGSWYRCCGGTLRKLVDCCGNTDTRINGDGALTGYCYSGRKVFCVQYYQTRVPC
jgi:hypothetical protein